MKRKGISPRVGKGGLGRAGWKGGNYGVRGDILGKSSGGGSYRLEKKKKGGKEGEDPRVKQGDMP